MSKTTPFAGSGAALQYFSVKYGGLIDYIEHRDSSPSGGLFLGGNPDRVGLLVVNKGTAATLYVGPSATTGGNSGIPLATSGGSVWMDTEHDGILPTLPVYLYSSSTIIVYALELVRVVQN